MVQEGRRNATSNVRAVGEAAHSGRYLSFAERFMRSYDDQMEAAIGSFW